MFPAPSVRRRTGLTSDGVHRTIGPDYRFARWRSGSTTVVRTRDVTVDGPGNEGGVRDGRWSMQAASLPLQWHSLRPGAWRGDTSFPLRRMAADDAIAATSARCCDRRVAGLS